MSPGSESKRAFLESLGAALLPSERMRDTMSSLALSAPIREAPCSWRTILSMAVTARSAMMTFLFTGEISPNTCTNAVIWAC